MLLARQLLPQKHSEAERGKPTSTEGDRKKTPRRFHALIVLAHVLSPPLNFLGLLLVHPRDFVSGVAKRMQDFI